ncbi:MAG TPA: DUF416 family protein [Flavisolibacter sp.]|jgi:uncharacterized protein YjaG (DUF416 family)|nr:DUF416 family protein [Flavisolibacter sp.]
MQFKEFDALYKQQVYSLTYEEGLSLAVEVCKRLYFDYERFVSEVSWGDKDLLMDAIQLCEQEKSHSVDKNIVEDMLTKVDAVTPDTEDFGSYLGSYALNAAASVYETLQFIIDRDLVHVYNIGTYLTDTIDFKIDENQEEETSEEQNDEHQSMVEVRNYLLQKTNGRRTTSASQNSGRSATFSLKNLFGSRK